MIGATKDAPAPADTVPLFPVQSPFVYAGALNATCTTAVDDVRYANRNVWMDVLGGTTTQSLCARASVTLGGLPSAMLKLPAFGIVPLQLTVSAATGPHDVGTPAQLSKPGLDT